jgi:hypothetical protein
MSARCRGRSDGVGTHQAKRGGRVRAGDVQPGLAGGEPADRDPAERSRRAGDGRVRAGRAEPPPGAAVRCGQLAAHLRGRLAGPGEGIRQRPVRQPGDVPQPLGIGEGDAERPGYVQPVRPVLGQPGGGQRGRLQRRVYPGQRRPAMSASGTVLPGLPGPPFVLVRRSHSSVGSCHCFDALTGGRRRSDASPARSPRARSGTDTRRSHGGEHAITEEDRGCRGDRQGRPSRGRGADGPRAPGRADFAVTGCRRDHRGGPRRGADRRGVHHRRARMRTQLVAARTVGEVLADLATTPGPQPSGPPFPEVAGPREESLIEMATLLAERRGHPAKIEAVTDLSDPDHELNENGALLPARTPSWPAPHSRNGSRPRTDRSRRAATRAGDVRRSRQSPVRVGVSGAAVRELNP